MSIEITSDEYKKLQDLVNSISDVENAELEARITQRSKSFQKGGNETISQIPFFRAVEYYFQSNPQNTSWQQESLDIFA